jgi:cyclophilin family peptidyl-prolyl cis-trans isomerase
MISIHPNRGVRLGALVLVLAAMIGFQAPSGHAAEDARPQVRLTTSLGVIDLELLPDRAPQTAANFLRLVDDGFYDGLIFHRVVANFVIQAGGYDAAMNYREPPGTVVNESMNGVRNSRGTVAMARLADPDSADTQFFINVKDNGHLDARPGQPGYTVFGRVVAGMDVVTEIELADTGRRAGMVGVPETPIVIERAERLP